MNRILSFHHHGTSGNEVRMAPAYYIEAEYDKVAVRIYAEEALLWDAKFDIFNDGISIFNNKTSKTSDIDTGRDTTGDDDTTINLSKGANSDELAENFTKTLIAKDSWVYCNLIDAGGGKNFTVQLELRQTSEDEIED